MKIEVGKYYKTREGKKVFVIADKRQAFPSVKVTYFFIVVYKNGDTAGYTEDGNYYLGSNCASDIISEWVEPHPLEGTPVGTLIYVWSGNKDSNRHIVEKFVEITDSGNIRTIDSKGCADIWTNGCRIPPTDI